jgi:hypothetical protein
VIETEGSHALRAPSETYAGKFRGEIEALRTQNTCGMKASMMQGHAWSDPEKEKFPQHVRKRRRLDRVRAAMLLQASGRTNGLRALVKAEQDRSPDFLRLANALSALYPKRSEEKRLLDAMLLAVPR